MSATPTNATAPGLNFSSRFEELLYINSPSLQLLRAIKSANATSPATQAHFAYKRATRQLGGPKPKLQAQLAEQSFKDSDRQMGEGLTGGAVHRFLDLGAAPGGWSKWLLTRNPAAKGTGIELPVAEGGRILLMDGWSPELKGRYRAMFRDIRQVSHTLANPLAQSTNFDVVLAGAIPSEFKLTTPEAERVEHSGPRGPILFLKQLFLAFTYLRPGGVFVGYAAKKPFLLNSEILILLRESFSDGIKSLPGSERFATGSTYQLKCRGFDDAKREDGLARLRRALDTLEAGGSTHTVGKNGVLLLDGTEEEIFARERDWLLRHYEPLWEFQMAAIRKRTGEVTPSTVKMG